MDVDRKTFATMCGTKVTIVNVNVKRNKVIVMDNGLIDTDNKINHAFMKKYQNKVQKKDPAKQREKLYKEVVQTVKAERIDPVKKPSNREQQNEESEEVAGLDLRKKKAEVLKVEREAYLKLLDINKKNGEALPTDFVIRMTTVLIREMLANLDKGTIRIAGKFCDRVGANRKMLADVNNDLNKLMQKIIDEAKEDLKHQINKAIKEYSVTRNKGERGK